MTTLLLDPTVLIDVLRDKPGRVAAVLSQSIQHDDVYVSRASELELLSGARNDKDWIELTVFLSKMAILEPGPGSWYEAARLYFDLRRRGLTVRNRIDCLIAQTALDRGFTLVHNDRDFETIATVRPLRHRRFKFAP